MKTLQIGMTASRRHISGNRSLLSLAPARTAALGVAVRGVVLGDPRSLDEPTPGIEGFAPEGASRFARWSGLRRAVARADRGCRSRRVARRAARVSRRSTCIRKRPLVVQFHGPWALEGRAEGIGELKFRDP